MIKIIPAIDIIDGKCVRLTKGDYSQRKIYNENPLETAKRFQASGIKYLHLVDLDGAKEKRIVNWRLLKQISDNTDLIIDFGGGIRSENDLHLAFENGAAKVTAGSIAVLQKEIVHTWIGKYNGKIILGADTQNGIISINAWQEMTDLHVLDFIKDYKSAGIKSAIVTDIARDGVLKGPAFNLYEKIKKAIPDIEIIASGGISKIDDIYKLNAMKIDGVIVGKAFYEGKIKLNELKEFLC